MIPWAELDTTTTPDGENEVTLYQRGTEFSIRVNGQELMNSRVHESEKALAALACEKIREKKNSRVLIGGLGMGFTLASALEQLPEKVEVVQVELLPAMVTWHERFLGHLCSQCVSDPRVRVETVDLVDYLRSGTSRFDAVILDVDNGPEALTQEGNSQLYDDAGLWTLKNRLKPGGVLAVWSAGESAFFTRRLKSAGFRSKTHTVYARPNKKGGRHTIWIAVSDSR